MKKVRFAVFILTLLLGVVVLITVGLLVVSPKSASETLAEIVAVSISATSVAIAIITQISAYRERKNFDKVIHELREIDSEVEEDEVLEKEIRRKLDELIRMDKKIYKSVSRESSSKK